MDDHQNEINSEHTQSENKNKSSTEMDNDNEYMDSHTNNEETEETKPSYKLHNAARNFNAKEVEKLLQNGHDANESDDQGRNAIFTVLEKYVSLTMVEQIHAKPQYIEILSLLANKGLDINSRDKSKRTVLHFIVTQGNYIDIIKPLLAAGIKVNAQDYKNQTALHTAILKGHTANINVLAEGGVNMDLTDINGDAALHILCKGNRKLRLVQQMFRCGAQVNVRDLGRRTPLHIATKHSREDLVHELLISGAKANSRDSSGQTPLHYAMKYDMTGRIVKELLSRKAAINMQEAVSDQTPLHKTITHGTIEAFKLLVQNRPPPNPNVKDSCGETAMHKAAACQDIFVWKQLLSLGGDINEKNDSGQSALSKASRMKNQVALSLLREQGSCS